VNETQLIGLILAELGTSRFCRVWRNNTGMLFDRGGRPVKFGLKGSADISGILCDGRRLEIEVKQISGKQREDQKNFERMILKFGGVYILARSVDDATLGVFQAIKEHAHDPDPKSDPAKYPGEPGLDEQGGVSP
jgi:hypothetical protein